MSKMLSIRVGESVQEMDVLARDYFAAENMASPIGLQTALSSLPASIKSGLFDDDEEEDDCREYEIQNGVAVIPIIGQLIPSGPRWLSYFGISCYNNISADILAADEDPSVKGIVLRVDSPGGNSFGNAEVADVVAKAKKPICAVVASGCYSAAFMISSQADRIFINQLSGVGSIGCMAVHVDLTKMDKEMGIEYTYIQSGRRKAEFSPHKKLTDEARTSMENEVSRVAGIFFDYVNRGRGISVDAIQAMEGGVFYGPAAIEAGLADQIGGMQEAFSWVEKKSAGKSIQAGAKFSSEESIQIVEQAEEAGNDISAQADEAAPEAEMEGNFTYNKETIGLINAYCGLAGRLDLVGEFLSKELSPQEVLEKLNAMRSNQQELNSNVPANSGSPNGQKVMVESMDKLIRQKGLEPVVRQ